MKFIKRLRSAKERAARLFSLELLTTNLNAIRGVYLLHKFGLISTVDVLKKGWTLGELEIKTLSKFWKDSPDSGSPATYKATAGEGGWSAPFEPPNVVLTMSPEEQRARVFGLGIIRIPPQDLKEGDIVLLTKGVGGKMDREVKVVSVNIVTNVKSSSDVQHQVNWVDSDGNVYTSPGVGSHLVVKRPPVVEETVPPLPPGKVRVRKPRVRTSKKAKKSGD